MSRPQVQPLDPDTPKGAQIARELGELLAEIAVDVHRREQAEVESVAAGARRSRTGTRRAA